MEAITIRLSTDTLESIDDEADEHGRTRSEHIREVVRARNEHDRVRTEYEETLAEYEQRIDELERERERLREELRATNKRVDEHTELVAYVEEERELQQRREERRDAPAWRRAKWWLFGRYRAESEGAEP